MAALSRTRPPERRRQNHPAAPLHECECIHQPADAGDEWLTGIIAAGQVPPNDFIRDWQEPMVRTLRALDARLFADALYPFIGAGRCVAGFARFPALVPPRVDILTSAKERTEECDLLVWRRELMDETSALIHWIL